MTGIQTGALKATILVVDDEKDLREAIALQLRVKGYAVLEAESGNSAFRLLEKEKIDLVISDIRMPDGDGATLLKRIREHFGESLRVILMTGYADMAPEQAIASGASGFLMKPFRFKEVYDMIRLYVPG